MQPRRADPLADRHVAVVARERVGEARAPATSARIRGRCRGRRAAEPPPRISSSSRKPITLSSSAERRAVLDHLARRGPPTVRGHRRRAATSGRRARTAPSPDRGSAGSPTTRAARASIGDRRTSPARAGRRRGRPSRAAGSRAGTGGRPRCDRRGRAAARASPATITVSGIAAGPCRPSSEVQPSLGSTP